MRYDPSNVARPCIVWHVPSCKEVPRCLWVDDELGGAAVVCEPTRVIGGELAYDVLPFKHMTINPERTLILLDPVADEQPANERQAERVA